MPRLPLDHAVLTKYYKSMKKNTKSSLTLPEKEFKEVQKLKKRLGAKSYVAVVRQSLDMLRDSLDREQLKEGYRLAAQKVRGTSDVAELASEGLSEE